MYIMTKRCIKLNIFGIEWNIGKHKINGNNENITQPLGFPKCIYIYMGMAITGEMFSILKMWTYRQIFKLCTNGGGGVVFYYIVVLGLKFSNIPNVYTIQQQQQQQYNNKLKAMWMMGLWSVFGNIFVTYEISVWIGVREKCGMMVREQNIISIQNYY